VLEADAYAREVEEDLARAAAYEIRGVPFTVLNQRYAINGAQPVALFEEALRKSTE
jgi:protein disulfide-isomerase